MFNRKPQYTAADVHSYVNDIRTYSELRDKCTLSLRTNPNAPSQYQLIWRREIEDYSRSIEIMQATLAKILKKLDREAGQ